MLVLLEDSSGLQLLQVVAVFSDESDTSAPGIPNITASFISLLSRQ